MSDKQTYVSPPFIWVAVLGAIVCLCLFLLFRSYGYFPVERDLGPIAKIRYTPYYTASKLLELDDTTSQHFRSLKPLREPIKNVDSIVLAAKPGHLNQQAFNNLLTWVKAGGQLIYWANRKTESDTDLLLNYLDLDLLKDDIANKDKEIEDLLELGEEVLPVLGDLAVKERKPVNVSFEGMETNIEVGFDPSWHLSDYSGNAFYFSDNDKDHLLQYFVEKGEIIVMSDMNVWTNANIGEHDHGFLLQQFLAPANNKKAWFVFGGEHESAMSKLKKQAMPLFWIGLLFVALWLWQAIPRLGPKLSLNLYQRRNIGEHIAASSQLRWQLNQLPQWLKSQAKIIFKKAAIRNPSFSHLSQEEQINWLASIGSIDKKQLNYLYQAPQVETFKEAQFLELMHQLQQLKNKL